MSKLSELIYEGKISESDLTVFVEVLIQLKKHKVLPKKPKKIFKKLNKSLKRFQHIKNVDKIKQSK